jgi:hypothetical protein
MDRTETEDGNGIDDHGWTLRSTSGQDVLIRLNTRTSLLIDFVRWSARGSVVVKSLRYQPEGRGFDTR